VSFDESFLEAAVPDNTTRRQFLQRGTAGILGSAVAGEFIANDSGGKYSNAIREQPTHSGSENWPGDSHS
jgi:hypothetical protein